MAEAAAVALGAEHVGLMGIERLAAGGLLGFEHEAAALVAIDEAGGHRAVGVAEIDLALIDIVVAVIELAAHDGRGQAQRVAEAGNEELIIGAFGAAGVDGFGDQFIKCLQEFASPLVALLPQSGRQGKGAAGPSRTVSGLCLACWGNSCDKG